MNMSLSLFPNRLMLRRGLLFAGLIIAALVAFETFNYSTTDFALTDLLGDLKFLGVTWSTILAVAFCGIDFAGIARLFTPEQGSDEPAEVWYLFGAWMLAATMNAMLTWWGVSIAILNHQTLGNAVVDRETLIKVVPIFVAIMVWLIRVLIIGTISVAGDRFFSQVETGVRDPRSATRKVRQSTNSQPVRSSPARSLGRTSTPVRRGVSAGSYHPAPKPRPQASYDQGYGVQEPTYHPVSMTGNQSNSTRQNRF
jgi:hypothetical protein